MNSGFFIKLDRTFPEHWLYDCKPYDTAHAWIDMIYLADVKDHKKLYRGRLKEFKRGSVNLSIAALADRWGWSKGKTKRFLKMLESDGMIQLFATTHDTTVTLVNYGVYQDKRSTNRTTDGQQMIQQTDIRQYIPKDIKDIKDIKERKEIESLPPGVKINPDGTLNYFDVESNLDG